MAAMDLTQVPDEATSASTVAKDTPDTDKPPQVSLESAGKVNSLQCMGILKHRFWCLHRMTTKLFI